MCVPCKCANALVVRLRVGPEECERRGVVDVQTARRGAHRQRCPFLDPRDRANLVLWSSKVTKFVDRSIMRCPQVDTRSESDT